MGNNCLRPDRSCLHRIFVLEIAHKPTHSYSFFVTISRSVSRFLKQKKTTNANKRREKEKKLLLETWQELHTFCKAVKTLSGCIKRKKEKKKTMDTQQWKETTDRKKKWE